VGPIHMVPVVALGEVAVRSPRREEEGMGNGMLPLRTNGMNTTNSPTYLFSGCVVPKL